MSCRIFVNHSLQTDMHLQLDQETTHYLLQVMRRKIGDPIIVFNGHGGEFSGRITAVSGRQVVCELHSFHNVDRELPCHVHIVQAATRNEKLESVLQKGTELGAASFTIVRSERSILHLQQRKLAARLERWKKIIIEAAEQSGRTMIPDLLWYETLAEIQDRGTCFALHPESATSWEESRPLLSTATVISLAIGPEGGWSTKDLRQLAKRGYAPLAFGPRIMRCETAAPALLAAIQAIYGTSPDSGHT